MSKDDLYEAITKLIFEESASLSREEYRNLLAEVASDCEIALRALDDDEAE